MKNFIELTIAEQKELLDMLPSEMTEDQKVQFCQYTQDRYNVSDYFDESKMIERLSYMLQCHREINKQHLSPEENATLRVLCETLDHCSSILTRLYYDIY